MSDDVSAPERLMRRLSASDSVTSKLVQLALAAAAQSRHVSCMRCRWPGCSRQSAMICIEACGTNGNHGAASQRGEGGGCIVLDAPLRHRRQTNNSMCTCSG